jgi:hypothetical protein
LHLAARVMRSAGAIDWTCLMSTNTGLERFFHAYPEELTVICLASLNAIGTATPLVTTAFDLSLSTSLTLPRFRTVLLKKAHMTYCNGYSFSWRSSGLVRF